MIGMLDKIKKLCLPTIVLSTIGLAVLAGLAYLPIDYIFGSLDDHDQEIQDLQIIVSSLPHLQKSIDDGFASINERIDKSNERIDKSNEEITKLRLLICEDSKGAICN